MNKTVKIAAGLLPLIASLYEDGILRIDGADGDVQCRESFFREAFDEYDVKPFDMNNVLLEAHAFGVKFFTISERG